MDEEEREDGRMAGMNEFTAFNDRVFMHFT